MGRTRIHCAWETTEFRRHYRSGVSLHGHTSVSREDLKFLGGFKRHFPLIPAILRIAARQHRRATGEALDIRRAGWRPPLVPASAWAVEARQIERLGLDAMVSLTDHDDIDAGGQVAGLARPGATAVSVEWTVPFGATFFHLGVHNLPAGGGPVWQAMREYTRRPTPAALSATLAWLHRHEGVLTVLNHPLWDEAAIGADAHQIEVCSLLAGYGEWIDAVEINGLRSRAENSAVARLAEEFSKPLISGGDRHGAEPNAVLNLTNTRSFSEFVDEVKGSRQSTILLMPQFREPLRLRWLQTVWDLVRSYPAAREGWRHWSDRFFYCCPDGIDRSVAQVWKTSRPPVLDQALAMLRITEVTPLRPALRLLLADRT